MQGMMVRAFAKLNLGLRVGARRKDGFHDLEGIFQNVSIEDHLVVRLREQRDILIEGELGCSPESSTVYKAARIMFDRHAPGLGAHIQVTKGIPSGAGLGGAGADAAAVLVALDSLLGLHLSKDALVNIAAMVASDVPFFIHGGACIVRGRGEMITPLPARTDFGIVLVQPPWHSGTPAAYAALDAIRVSPEESSVPLVGEHQAATNDAVLSERYRGSLAQWQCQNDFLPVLRAMHPVYDIILNALAGTGAVQCSVTGSGACCYGIFESPEAAVRAAAQLNALRSIDPLLAAIVRDIRALEPLARSMIVSYIETSD